MNMQLIMWKLPREGSIKIIFDGSKSSAGATTNFVIHDWQGDLIMSGCHFMDQASISLVEATTVREGIKVAL